MKDLIEKTKKILETKGIDFSMLATDEIEAMEVIITATSEALRQSPVSGQLAIEALEKIAFPIKYLKSEAEKAGGVLSGSAALQLSSDHNWLKGIAIEALGKIDNYH